MRTITPQNNKGRWESRRAAEEIGEKIKKKKRKKEADAGDRPQNHFLLRAGDTLQLITLAALPENLSLVFITNMDEVAHLCM